MKHMKDSVEKMNEGYIGLFYRAHWGKNLTVFIINPTY